jgi:DNA-binding response OmpR family regulator
VRAVLRRGETPEPVLDAPIAIGDLRIDPRSRVLTLSGTAVDLTRMEFDLLVYLLAQPGRVFMRTHLLEAVWGYPDGVDSRTVDVHVAQLRRKLGARCPVRTVRGVGYKAETG